MSMTHTCITVLGAQAKAKALTLVSGVLSAHKYHITNMCSLDKTDSAIALNVVGRTESLAQLRGALRRVAEFEALDICAPPLPLSIRQYKLIAFDMDSTLIRVEVIDELARQMGVENQVSAITEAAMRGELDFEESFRKRVSLLKGLHRANIAQVVASARLMQGARLLVETLRAAGYKTAILSGGFTFMAHRLKDELSIDYIRANQLEMLDGAASGVVSGPVVDGKLKATLLAQIAAVYGFPLSQVIAVGDGANDLPMLHSAGLGIAFHAKPVVRAQAQYAISHAGLEGVLYYLGAEPSRCELHSSAISRATPKSKAQH